MTPVYVEWIDMASGERNVTDGPFAFVESTYDSIRAQRPGESDDELIIGRRVTTTDSARLQLDTDEGWIRSAEEGNEYGGWYSDVVISTVEPEQKP